MRKALAGFLALMLVAAASVGAAADPSSAVGHRILLSEAEAAQEGIPVRHALGSGRVSAHVTDAQLAALNRKGVTVEPVSLRWVDAPPLDRGNGNNGNDKGNGNNGNGNGNGNGKKSARVLPTTQVPYGIKMIYGDPSLTREGVSGGAGITVAVLDTGSIAHPDFIRADGSSIITACVDFTKNRPKENACKDGHGHGTHVTGIIAAAGGLDGQGLYGVAPNANIFSFKVMSDKGSGYADDIAKAIIAAADRGAQVINLSLSAPALDGVELDAIRYAVSKGVLVVSSAGNRGPEAGTIGYPGGFAETVAVAALGPNQAVASFSGRGITDGDDSVISDREVEVAAPGVAVLSTYMDGAYRSMNGTSMAAPHIAGLAAKRWQGSGEATRLWLQEAARANDVTTADGLANAGPGYDIASGYGLPQVRPATEAWWFD